MIRGDEDEWGDTKHRPMGYENRAVDARVDRPIDSYLSVNPQPLSFENRDPVLAQVLALPAQCHPQLGLSTR